MRSLALIIFLSIFTLFNPNPLFSQSVDCSSFTTPDSCGYGGCLWTPPSGPCYRPSTTASGPGIDLGEALKLNPNQPVREVFPDLGSLISTLLPNILMVSGVILFFLIIAGGFMVVSSAGNAEKTDKGKQAITGAIIGFVIIFASYWIIQIIEIITGVNILNSTL